MIAQFAFSRTVLNLCMYYTSQDEIATAVRDTIHDALLEGRIKSE